MHCKQTHVISLQAQSLERAKSKRAYLKNAGQKVAQLYSHYNRKRADRCARCGDWLQFAKYKRRKKRSKSKKKPKFKIILARGNFCGLRYCPSCSQRKEAKIIARLADLFEHILNTQDVRFSFFTDTFGKIKLHELGATLDKMSEAYRKLMRDPELKRVCRGYVRFVELLGSKTPLGFALPHGHSLLIFDRKEYNKHYISQRALAHKWSKALGKRGRIVHIKSIKTLTQAQKAKMTPAQIKKRNRKDAEDIANYFAKYALKTHYITNLPPKDFQTLDEQTKGICCYTRGGIARKPFPRSTKSLEQEGYTFEGYAYLVWNDKQKKYYWLDLGAFLCTKDDQKREDILTPLGFNYHDFYDVWDRLPVAFLESHLISSAELGHFNAIPKPNPDVIFCVFELYGSLRDLADELLTRGTIKKITPKARDKEDIF